MTANPDVLALQTINNSLNLKLQRQADEIKELNDEVEHHLDYLENAADLYNEMVQHLGAKEFEIDKLKKHISLLESL